MRTISTINFGRYTLRRLPRLGKIRVMAAAVMSSLVMTVGIFSGTAHAAASDCGSNWSCFWYDAGYVGLRQDWYIPPNYVCFNFSSTFNDQISSVINHGIITMSLYADANCVNWVWPNIVNIAAQAGDGSLSGSGMNDKASSFKLH